MDGSFVADNSVVMSWCFQDEANEYAESVLDRLSDAKAFVPSIWPLEVVNVLLIAERRRRITEADSVHFLTLLALLPIVVEHERPDRVIKDLLALGGANSLSSYDASYLDLAMRKGIPLATLNEALIKAAKTVHVPILSF
jgi:predicted nucleic acid-binding protein